MGWSPRPAVSDSHDSLLLQVVCRARRGSAAPTLQVPLQELSDAGGTSSATVGTPCWLWACQEEGNLEIPASGTFKEPEVAVSQDGGPVTAVGLTGARPGPFLTADQVLPRTLPGKQAALAFINLQT